MNEQQVLVRGLEALGLDPDPVRVAKLLDYAAELQKWNRVYNLTAIAPGEDTVSRHLLDSLSVAAALTPGGARVVDVGSGAGLPGIPLALYRPEIHFTLLDSAGKRTRFVEHIRIRLGLPNVEVAQGRAEAFSGQFDKVICRGLGSLAEIAEMTAHLLAPSGQILAMKGDVSQQELAGVVPPVVTVRIDPLIVPGLDARRSLVIMEVTPRP